MYLITKQMTIDIIEGLFGNEDIVVNIKIGTIFLNVRGPILELID